MATIIWKLSLLLASCSFALSSLRVYAFETKLDSSRVSYKPQNQIVPTSNLNSQAARKLLADLSVAANSPVDLMMNTRQAQMQPNIYHSIIDRSTASTQLASPVQATTATVGDLNTAAGHHHGQAHGKYYEYREVPKKKTWKFGYKRGNHKHTIERHEHGKAGKHPHFKTKVKWHDKKSKGKGIHLWDYNHHDKKHYHHG